MKQATILLLLGLVLSTTGCGTMLNLTGLSMLADPEVRPAAVMGGAQTDDYFLKHPGRSSHPCDPLAVVLDLLLSVAADVALLPITMPLAAIVGDGPFASEERARPAPKDETAEDPD